MFVHFFFLPLLTPVFVPEVHGMCEWAITFFLS